MKQELPENNTHLNSIDNTISCSCYQLKALMCVANLSRCFELTVSFFQSSAVTPNVYDHYVWAISVHVKCGQMAVWVSRIRSSLSYFAASLSSFTKLSLVPAVLRTVYMCLKNQLVFTWAMFILPHKYMSKFPVLEFSAGSRASLRFTASGLELNWYQRGLLTWLAAL